MMSLNYSAEMQVETVRNYIGNGSSGGILELV